MTTNNMDEKYISQIATKLYNEGIVDTSKTTPPETTSYIPSHFEQPIYTPYPLETSMPTTTNSDYLSHLNTSNIISPDYYFLPVKDSLQQSDPANNSLTYNTNSIRKDFPILHRKVNGKPLIWLDNSATTQKPLCVINALNKYYKEYNSNVHRGAHTLAALATDAYEKAREKVQQLIGASSPEEIVFVRGATEAINLVAQTYGKTNIKEGDVILLTTMEHHSNIVPWQNLQKEKGAVLNAIPINNRGEIIMEDYKKLLASHPKLVALTHVSNVLGTINPIKTMIEMAHAHGAIVLIDGAQSTPHVNINVQELNADFYVFSGHKIYAPTGIGVLYGKRALLEEIPPWQSGGGMIKDVSFENTTYNGIPNKFEAGTGNIADAIGLGAAIDYINKIGIKNIERHEKGLTKYAMDGLSSVPKLTLIGTAPNKTSVLSFIIDGIEPDKAARFLNQHGIAVRSGHHCAQPALHHFGLDSTIRASLGMYNTVEEINTFIRVLNKLVRYHR